MLQLFVEIGGKLQQHPLQIEMKIVLIAGAAGRMAQIIANFVLRPSDNLKMLHWFVKSSSGRKCELLLLLPP